MIVISSREFRANQGKYFDLAQEDDVIIKTRSRGSFQLTPVEEEEDKYAMSWEELDRKIKEGNADYAAGRTHDMQAGESVDEYVDRLIREHRD